MIYIVIILSIALFLAQALIAWMALTIKKNKEIDKRRRKSEEDGVKHLFKKIEELSGTISGKTRYILGLERTIEKGYGIKVRPEIKKIQINYTKLETVIMLSGLSLLLERAKNPDDAEAYINLTRKIQSFIDDMDEEENKNTKY